jgi:hypothetical protein
MLFLLESASISIELSSTGSALTAFVASNNSLIASRKNFPTTFLSDMEAISLIAGYRFNQEGEICKLSNITELRNEDYNLIHRLTQ